MNCMVFFFVYLQRIGCFALLLLASQMLSAQAIQTVIFEDDFNTGAFHSDWILRPSMTGSNGVVELVADEGIGGAGDFAVVLGKSAWTGGFATNALDLPIDLSNYPNVEMTFWIRDYQDVTNANDGLYFSDNGGASFKKILAFDPSVWCDYYGKFPPIQLSKLANDAGLNPVSSQAVIRFQQQGENPTWSDGTRLDEIKVYVPDLVYVPVRPNQPFVEDFETLSLRNMWATRNSFQTTVIQTGDPLYRPSNWIEPISGAGVNGSHGLLLGKRCHDGGSVQSVDLHLDLQENAQVELTFMIYSGNDITQIDDGIYFSNDGGASFVKIIDWEPSQWCSNQYDRFPPFDIDELVKDAGLSLTNQSIIRFQQRSDFASHIEAFYLDDIKVSVSKLAYAQLPFSETFETGSFRNMWEWSFADKTTQINTGVPTTRPSNVVEVRNGIGRQSSYAAILGKNCYDGFATNALDLLLNLENQDNVVMNFFMKDYGDITHLDDGLYMSDDGGRTFVKVRAFDFSNIQDVYADYTFHISDSLQKFGLSATDSFVVRFQQHGETPTWRSGFSIDDVSVTGTPTTSIARPKVSLLEAYPNPTYDLLTVSLPEARKVELALYDLHGRRLEITCSRQGQEARLDLSALPAGLYQLQVMADQTPYRLPVVKM